MSSHLSAPLIIIGAGPAGYTAALYALRAGLRPLLLTGAEPGGQLMTTTSVENWPGDPTGLTGPGLMQRMEAHLDSLAFTPTFDTLRKIIPQAEGFVLEGDLQRYQATAIILATGARARYLGLPSEAAYVGHGVSACATCDGFVYKGAAVAVVGGGNSAVEEAIYLSGLASHVTLIHRRDQFRAEAILVQRLHAHKNITLRLNSEVEEVLGSGGRVTAVRLARGAGVLPVQALFVAIGHIPNTAFVQGWLRTTDGFIDVRCGRATQTSYPGVFAAGDCCDPHYQQAITAAGSGCMAALDAQAYLAEVGA